MLFFIGGIFIGSIALALTVCMIIETRRENPRLKPWEYVKGARDDQR